MTIQPTYPPGSSRQRKDARQKQKSILPSFTCGCSCAPILLIAAILGLLTAVYFFSPGRTNILLLGIDNTPKNSDVGRSDTNILTTIVPVAPYVGMLSIPRDLWLEIPGVGANRINTAHFFAEAAQPGSGPDAAMQTIRENFGIDVGYYIRIKFDGFRDVFDAMGGVDINLDEPTAGYEPGRHHLTGRKALAFARNRSGSDDFFRMEQGQLILKSAFRKMLSPINWWRVPGVTVAMLRAIDTNIPIWIWPRLAFTFLRVGPSGIDNRSIGRDLVTPTITDQGANILLPNWDLINPLLLDMFDQ